MMELEWPPKGEPDELTLDAMQIWLETGCVPQEYLDKVLGDQSVVVTASEPPQFHFTLEPLNV